MDCKVLVSILSELNQEILVTALKMKPEKLILLIPRDFQDYPIQLEALKVDCGNYLNSVEFETMIFDTSIESIALVIEEISRRERVYLNLSKGSPEAVFIFQHLAQKKGLSVVFSDIPNKKIYCVNELGELVEEISEAELTVEDLLSCSGAEIISQSTHTYELASIGLLIDYICDHYSEWKEIVHILKDRTKTIDPNPGGLELEFNLMNLSYMRVGYLIQFIQYFEAKGLFLTPKSGMNYRVAKIRFRQMELKKFMLTTGSWLEALTYRAIKNIQGVDDAKSGVLFLWDKDTSDPRNELDVLASLDSRMICVSCKDTDELSTHMLNELEVYADRIGGEHTIKFLVTSYPIHNYPFINRATEMNIHLVYFDGNYNTFFNLLSKKLLKD